MQTFKSGRYIQRKKEKTEYYHSYTCYSSRHQDKMVSPKSAILSSLDQLMPPCYIRIFLVFETKNHEVGIQSLTQGLSALTKHMPYLKGRVFKAEEGDRWAIKWSDDDADPELQEIVLGANSSMPSYGPTANCAS